MRFVLASLIIYTPWFLPPAALAEGLVPCDGSASSKCELAQLLQLFDNVLSFLVTIGGILLVIIIILGGVYLASSRGNAAVQTKVRSLIVNAIIGYVLLLGAWFLVETFFNFFAPDQPGIDILKGA